MGQHTRSSRAGLERGTIEVILVRSRHAGFQTPKIRPAD